MSKNKMLLSELIANAQRILDAHGDIPVEISINNSKSKRAITTGFALKDESMGEIEIHNPIFIISG